MKNARKNSMFVGLSGIDMQVPTFEFGEGITLTRTYAHLMSPFVMAFKPAPAGSHHPGPWKAAHGGTGFDISAELAIPESAEWKPDAAYELARTFIFLIRAGVNPSTTLTVLSDHSFSSVSDAHDNEVRLVPVEIYPRYFSLKIENGQADKEALEWVKERWKTTHRLMNENPEFALAVNAIEGGQFVRQPELSMLSLWGAMEAMFSHTTTELRFRVSSMIAAFLEPPGDTRYNLQKEIAKLYDKRSAAAHGKPTHKGEDLLATFNLLRRVLLKIIDEGVVPTKESLEKNLFTSK